MELVNEIDAISRREDRSKTAIVRRAIALYGEQSGEQPQKDLVQT